MMHAIMSEMSFGNYFFGFYYIAPDQRRERGRCGCLE